MDRMTTAEFLAYCDQPENADRILDFIDGEIVQKTLDFIPSVIEASIGFYISGYAMEHRSGLVTGASGGYLIPNGNVFNPDVAYISKERLPERPPREAPVPPDLAVEVKSPTDYKRKMRNKADKYIEAGTRLVWLVFPDEQVVEIYAPERDVETVGIDGVLDGGDVLPGFTLPVTDIFTTLN